VAHASTYALHEAHNDEKVTIAVEPVDTPQTSNAFKVNYRDYGLLPIRLLISNDSDQTLMLDSLKIEYITARRDKLQPATNEDIYRKFVRPNRADKAILAHTCLSCGKEKRSDQQRHAGRVRVGAVFACPGHAACNPRRLFIL